MQWLGISAVLCITVAYLLSFWTLSYDTSTLHLPVHGNEVCEVLKRYCDRHEEGEKRSLCLKGELEKTLRDKQLIKVCEP